MSAFLVFGLGLLIVIGIIIASLVKQMKKGEGGILGIRQQPLIMDFDSKTVGRLAGQPLYKSDAVDIPYKTGMFSVGWIRDVPEFALLYYEPPTTSHAEGVYVILPHTYGQLTGFKLWDNILSYNHFFEMKSKILEADMIEMEKMVNESIDRDKFMKQLKTMQDHFNVLKSGMNTSNNSLQQFSLETKQEPKVVVQKKVGKT